MSPIQVAPFLSAPRRVSQPAADALDAGQVLSEAEARFIAEAKAILAQPAESAEPPRPTPWQRIVRWLRGGRRRAVRRHLEAVAVAESAELLSAVAEALATRHDLTAYTATKGLLDDAARRLEPTDPARAARLRASNRQEVSR